MSKISPKMSCPVCLGHAPLFKVLPEVTLYGECNLCGHRFTDVQSINCLTDYSEQYYDEKHANWFANPNIKLFDAIFSAIKKHNSTSSVLDIGCGDGAFLRYLKGQSPDLDLNGIDFHKNEEDKGIKYYCGDLFDVKFDKKYDVIVSLAVIEHVWDVVGYMKRLSSLCNVGGLVIVMTINDDCLVYSISRLLYYVGVKSPMVRLYEKHHLNHFSNKSLEYLVKNSGLLVSGRIETIFPMESVDLPTDKKIMKFLYRVALRVVFFVEKVTGKTFLQTIVAHK